jgi:hypothetical protein
MSTIPSIKPFIGSNQRLTRLSAILPAAALDTDVTLDQPFPSTVPRVRVVERTRRPGDSPLPGHGFALVAIAAVGMRRRRPR